MPDTMEQANHNKENWTVASHQIADPLFCRETDAEIWLPNKTLWLPKV